MDATGTNERDLFTDVVRHASLLAALGEGPLGRRAMERRLDVSTPTGYRLTGWLEEHGLAAESDRGFALTAVGAVVADAASTFETTVRGTVGSTTKERERSIEIIRRAPALAELREEPLDRRELERRLAVSKTTSHRFTRSLGELGLIERAAGKTALTDAGEVLADAASAFETTVRMALCLAPVIESMYDTTAPLDVTAFADATVTSAEHGDPYAPLARFVALVEETEAIHGINVFSVAPTYMDEIQRRIIDGMDTELVAPPAVAEDVMENYPERCVEVCVSGHLTHWLHTALPPYGLVVFDDRVGIGVCDAATNRLRLFVDTDAAAAREWAETVYASYRSDAVRLGTFTKTGLREALTRREATAVER